MYRVTIVNKDDGDGAFRTDANLAVAICEANRGAGAITDRALIVGVLAWAIIEEELDESATVQARKLIDALGVPNNMKELVDLMNMP